MKRSEIFITVLYYNYVIMYMEGIGGSKEHITTRIRNAIRKSWPEWLGGLLIGVVNVLFFAWANKPFTIYSGYNVWGQWIYRKFGFILRLKYSPPLFHKTSVGDIGLISGAFLAALLAREFRLRLPGRWMSYLEASIGGLLMALGVTLSRGCNWGGFFSGITALSLHGFAMFPGLIVGGLLGSFYVKWRIRREMRLFVGSGKPERNLRHAKRSPMTSLPKIVGIIFIAFLLIFYTINYEFFYLGVFLFGIFVGWIIQRSRFCFATAFRDMLNPAGEFRRALRLQEGIVLGLLIAITGTAVLKSKLMIDPMIYIHPTGLSNILGGVFFGLGMVLAGGCASGILWRLGEGHIPQFVAIITTVLTYPLIKQFIAERTPWLISGVRAYIPGSLGWLGGMISLYSILLIWYIGVIWLEYKLPRR